MTKTNASPRDRLLKAANDLFYKEGIRNVGINRVLEASQTPIMTLYRHFGSKDGLAAAYLDRRGERTQEVVKSEAERRASSPREMILATFDILREGFEVTDYRGCAFLNATVEMASPDHEVAKIARHHKNAGRQWFAELAAEAGVPDPAGLAIQLTVLLDGATAAAVLYRDSSGAAYARSAAETLIDAALTNSALRLQLSGDAQRVGP
ncbi:TetR/AcrR family transcriptional regulator [Mycobacterium paraintracellulare]|uniref:TetR/AcrR family transcriptional regulator n=1 Tax=Mycobacterium paraintracellulare TaxID=1138383 RepID=UPI001926301C|nr:TetR/AcrR family transcriptional regulator [Mycobacterium paraintracellulare]BCP14125.1 TetR family transcriptional regulator [Mycobacterium paraintracellulare]